MNKTEAMLLHRTSTYCLSRILKSRDLYCMQRSSNFTTKSLNDLNYMNTKVPSIKFYNGIEMPIIGLGTWQASDEEINSSIDAALKYGYRHIDTAYSYRNEHAIGKALKKWFNSKEIAREDLFIVTKLPLIGMQPNAVEKYLMKSLEALQTSYVDLYLIHLPIGVEEDEALSPATLKQMKVDNTTDHILIWKEMEKQVDLGRARSIGLSNFNSRQIYRIVKASRIKPANVQVELNVYFQQRELAAFCRALDITVCAYAPLGSPGLDKYIRKVGSGSSRLPEVPLLSHPVILELSQKYRKLPSNILLHHIIQRGIAAIPKSTNPQRIMQNIQIFDFELSKEDVEKLDKLDKGPNGRCFRMDWAEGMFNHPEYPFKDRY